MKRLLPALLLSLLACSCTVYHPQLSSLPLMSHQGEVQLSAAYQSDLFLMPQGNIDAAYAFTDHLAAQGHLGISSTDFFNTHLALGAYFPLPHHAIVETYLGGGYGKSDQYNSKQGTWFRMAYTPVFAQINFGFRDLTKANIDLGASIKAGCFPFDGVDNYNGTPKDLNGCYALLEPQLMFRIGSPMVKFQLQAGYNWFFNPTAENPRTIDFTYVPLCLSAGISLHF